MAGLYKIAFFIGCRSDAGLVAPIIRRLEKDPTFKIYTCNLVPMDFKRSYRIAEVFIQGFKPDLAFINADRVEMAAACQAAFLHKCTIAHYQGGVVNIPITTYDDILRHIFTLQADIHFVEGEKQAELVWMLRDMLGLSTDHIFNVGITHLDDLETSPALIPGVPYDLLLYNTPTIGDYQGDLDHIKALLSEGRYTVMVSSNPDGHSDSHFSDIVNEFYMNVPRPEFHGLLKNCQRFITNSSSAITEAPYFLKPEQIIMIGNRNKNRTPVDCKPGGSDKIVKILKEIAAKNLNITFT